MWDHSPMNPEDPERYIRDLERGVSQTPGTAPPPFDAVSGSPFSPPPPFRTRRRAVNLVIAMISTIIFANAVYWGVYFLHGGPHHSGFTVHGNLEMNDHGAKYTIACNDGKLKLNGDNNTYTVTGHCLRLDVFGKANHVTVDSADSISVSGDDNAMIYRSGSRTINKTGNNNTVSQG
jgi:Protein of unknown function (DUF3060)